MILRLGYQKQVFNKTNIECSLSFSLSHAYLLSCSSANKIGKSLFRVPSVTWAQNIMIVWEALSSVPLKSKQFFPNSHLFLSTEATVSQSTKVLFSCHCLQEAFCDKKGGSLDDSPCRQTFSAAVIPTADFYWIIQGGSELCKSSFLGSDVFGA